MSMAEDNGIMAACRIKNSKEQKKNEPDGTKKCCPVVAYPVELSRHTKSSENEDQTGGSRDTKDKEASEEPHRGAMQEPVWRSGQDFQSCTA